jgi:hypothetical protein
MSLIKKTIVFGMSVLASLALIDVYLQLAEIQTPMETRIDPKLGPAYIPGKHITRFNEGLFIGSANAFGYMGPAVPPRRRDGELRILMLGDSFVLGHTVLPRQYFGRVLEDRLGAAVGKVVRAMNFGKADFNLGNMFQYYEDFASTFDHDLALFFVGEGDLLPSHQVVSSLYPGVSVRDGRIIIDRSFRSSRTYRFYRAIEPVFTRSAVLRLAFNTYKVVESGSWEAVVLDKLAALLYKPRGKPGSSVPQRPQDLPELSRAVLRELAKDPRNVLVLQTSLEAGLRAEVAAAGLPLIDLGAYLDQLLAQGQDPYYWPVTGMRGHWNHAAQSLIGRFLADQITGMGRF